MIKRSRMKIRVVTIQKQKRPFLPLLFFFPPSRLTYVPLFSALFLFLLHSHSFPLHDCASPLALSWRASFHSAIVNYRARRVYLPSRRERTAITSRRRAITIRTPARDFSPLSFRCLLVSFFS